MSGRAAFDPRRRYIVIEDFDGLHVVAAHRVSSGDGRGPFRHPLRAHRRGGRQWVLAVPVRRLAAAIDTVLLAAALALMIIVRQYPFVNGWLTRRAYQRGSPRCSCSATSIRSRGRTTPLGIFARWLY